MLSEIHTAEVIGYTSSYYMPGEGYCGPINVEAAFEKQRRKSIDLVIAALERYTGLDYGTNVEGLVQWAEKRKDNELERAANRIPPAHLETNQPSSASSSR